jgi:hypothetical protein
MKPFVAVGVSALLFGVSQAAHADDKAACLDASSQGQTLRDAHKLVEAREQLRVCARASCPGVVQKDCAMWLDEVEKALPTIVLSAKDPSGKDIAAAKVSEKGKLLTATLDGAAIAMNPGAHTFRFELADGTFAEVQAVVGEGDKALKVAATLGKAAEAPSAVATAVSTPKASEQPPVQPTTETAKTDETAPRPSRTGAYVAGGVGIAGIVVGSITGLVAMGKKHTADQYCDGAECVPPGTDAGNSARTFGNVSTVAFGVGIAGLATGAVLWFTAKPKPAESQVTASSRWHADIAPLPTGGFMLSTGRAW